MKGFLIKVAAGLTVAAICGAAGYVWRGQIEQGRLDAAPRVYVAQLDRLIGQAVEEGEDKAILNARAIVATRNSLANSLMAISGRLDGEIDKLADEIGEPALEHGGLGEPGAGSRDPDKKAAYQTILVLQKVWPAKKAQIEVELRKVFAEMGLPLSGVPAQTPTTPERIDSTPPPPEKSPASSVSRVPPTPEQPRSATTNKSTNSELLSSILPPGSPVDDTTIYAPSQVGMKPQITSKVTPRYTSEARNAGTEGIVRVSAILRKDGTITDIKVVRGLGHGLDGEAIKATRNTKFTPGQKDGKPVNVRMTFDFAFGISSGTHFYLTIKRLDLTAKIAKHDAKIRRG